MRIAIVGPGALGLFLAARLSRLIIQKPVQEEHGPADTVGLLDYNRERAAQLRETGVWLEDESGSFRVPINAEVDPQSMGIRDVVFLCVKVPALSTALDRLSPLLGPETLLVGMQNGIGHPELIARASGVAALGVTSEGVTLLSPGRVAHRGRGVTRLGLLASSNPAATRKIVDLAVMLNKADIRTEVVDSVPQYLWAKLLINVGINALTAIYDLPNGAILQSPELSAKMEQAVREAAEVARALCIPLETDPVAATMEVCRATASNISSMLQDVRKGRPTEIDAINGAVVREGQRLSIPTPVNSELTEAVKALERSYLRENTT